MEKGQEELLDRALDGPWHVNRTLRRIRDVRIMSRLSARVETLIRVQKRKSYLLRIDSSGIGLPL